MSGVRRPAAKHRAAAIDYVYRHVSISTDDPEAISRSVRDVLLVVAREANAQGRARITQPMIAEARSLTVRTVEMHMRVLLRPEVGKPWLTKGGGRTYVIRGFAEHIIGYCGHPACMADAARLPRTR